jgi:outer membrane protein OmpA-like peptidoglycan-associated protein
MSKRWLACVVLVISAWTSTALASLSSSSTPPPGNLSAGNVDVNATATVTGTASSSSVTGDTLDHFHLTGAGCAQFTITPQVALPHLITTVTPMSFDVAFAPVARGALSCTVSFHDASHGSLGTDFTVTGTGVAQQISAPASQSFGSVRVANAAVLTASANLAIGNVGDTGHALHITDLSISGSTDFTITTAPALPATVTAPSGTITVSVQFNPSVPGLQTATLDIASDDPVTPVKSVNLSGTGTNAVIAVTDVGFGVVNLGATSTKTIAVTNTAAAPVGALRLASATISGGAGWFTFDANGFSCLGATTCTFGGGIVAPQSIGVRCVPPAGSTGSMTATVAFASDSDGGGDNVSQLACEAGRADLSADPTSLAYGAVDVGSTSVKTVTVSNLGSNLDLTFTATKVGARQADYTFSGCFTSCVVPAGTSKLFTVSFTPLTAGAADITINLASNDPDNPTVAIPVTATAVAPAITAPASLAFGNVEVVTTSQKTLTIMNSGSADLIISSAALTLNGGEFAIASGITGAQTVTAGSSASWDLTCQPTTLVVPSGRFTITSNALGAATKNVSLTCAGTEGILVTIPTSLNFAGVPENTVQFLPYKLRNTGNLTVSNIAATLDVLTVGYSLDPATPIPASLAPATEVSLNIRFAPLSGSDGGPATVTFTGTWGTGAKPLRAPAVLALDGDGQTTGYDTTVTTLDFGDLRFDAVVAKTFCITNTSQAPVQIRSPIAVTPAAGTTTGELTASATVKRQAACGVGGTSQTLPQTLTTGEFLEVTVVANPNNRIGALGATLTITSDLAVNPTRVVTLVGNSTTAGLTLAPGSTLDFGALDIQGAPATQTLTITNTGVAALDLASFARTANAHFTFTLPPNTTLAANQTLTIPVTYTPTAVTTPDEVVVLSSTIAGVLGGPTSQTITIRGRGIDRELALAPAPVFPDTFRNPGDAAPVRPVTVQNLGEATLHITATMLTSADPEIWALVDPAPIDIPGGASADFLVRFAPKMIGTAPPATLVLTNDDSDEMVAMVQLAGNGIDRNVAFGTREIDLGLTGIGIPVTIDDALLVASMDPANGFLIRNIAIVGDDVFTVVDAPNNLELPASATHTFAVTFTPESEGDFVATAQLFLDKDPVAQAEITLKGRAVFVDAHGGGGCATGHDLGGGGLLVVAGVLVALRRRHRALGVGAALSLGALGSLGSTARADNVALSVFDPTPATTGIGFQLQSPEVGKDGDWVVSAIVSHTTNPLVLDAVFDGKFINDDHVVERSTLLELGGAYAFLGRFEAGARMPIYAQDGQALLDSKTMFSTSPASGTVRGDLTLHAKARLWSTPGFSVAGGMQLTLPTATEGAFTGVDKPSARVLVLAALVPDTLSHRITLSANAGAVLRATSRYANLEQGSGIAWGLGVSVRALDRVWVATEVFGDMVPSGRQAEMGSSVTLSPVEWLAGLRYLPDRRFSVGLAGGRGLTRAAGSPELRGVVSLAFAPGAPMIRALHEAGPPKLDGDADGDGVRDSVDKCPNEPEDADLFDDADGCPDLDNDNDGVADAVDKCPLDAEDKDGFQDDDGCPEKDNDRDGVPDAQDRCPNEAEDKDGFEDLDGCPDLDNDHDGIPDAKDKCVNEAETINGIQDDDGCPDAGDSVIVLSPDRIETLDAIAFTGGTKLTRTSFNVLGQVAATLRAHPEIVRLRVTCHVQPTQNPDRDQELSDKRAQAVRDWLVQWGITASRVEARGFGGKKPLSPPEQRGSAAINERIELIILERK